MIKVIGVAIICLMLILLIRRENSVFAVVISVCAAILIFTFILSDVNKIFGSLSSLRASGAIQSGYITLMLKILGISIITQIVCDLCRDNGESALASQTEIASKIAVLSLLIPLFKTVIQIVTGLTK